MMEGSPAPLPDEDHLFATQQVDDRILKDVVAYVEVRTTNDNRSTAVRRELQLLGATVVKKFTNDVTHVVFKEGSNRTKTKAQKKGVHFVSVLWVDSCKRNQEHVSERMYPAIVPKQKGPNLFIAKLKKAKSMQPRDFDEEVSRSAERVNRKKRRLEALDRLKSAGHTPLSSPRTPMVFVQDTQPRSPDDGFVLTPVRLTIPDTPPSMREKMKQLKIGKEGSYLNEIEADGKKHSSKDFLGPLQRNLFMSSGMALESLSLVDSPGPNSVFTSEDDTKDMTGDTTQPSDNDGDSDSAADDDNENPLPKQTKPTNKLKVINHENSKSKDVRFSIIAENKDAEAVANSSHAAEDESDSSIMNDILDIAGKINATVNKKTSLDDSLTVDTDDVGSPCPGPGPPITEEVKDIQNDGANASKRIVTDINAPEADQHPLVGDSVPFVKVSHDAKDCSNKKKGKKSSLNINTRRKSRRISLQNVIDLIENDNDSGACNESHSKDVIKTDVSEEPPPDVEKDKIQSSAKDGNFTEKEIKNIDNENGLPEKKDVKNMEVDKENLAVSSSASDCFTTNDNNADRILNENNSKDEVRKGKSKPGRRSQSVQESKTLKTKAMPKKKLLSLTDLNDQHSVLIEPTKCSEAVRSELLDNKSSSERGRKKKHKPNSSDVADDTENTSIENESSDSIKLPDKNQSKVKTVGVKTRIIQKSKQNTKVADTQVKNASNDVQDDIDSDKGSNKTDGDVTNCKGRRRKSKVNFASRADNEGAKSLECSKTVEVENKQSPEKPTRGKKRKSKPCQNSNELVDEERNSTFKNMKADGDVPKEEDSNRGRKRKSKLPRSLANVSSPKQVKTATLTNQTDNEKLEKVPVMVNDTIIADKRSENSPSRVKNAILNKPADISTNVSQLGDITTQLNLTNNNSVTASIRDGTLSLSMSTVYNNDTALQSILISSQRKSIDEFNLSQRNRRTTKSKPHLSTIKENRKMAYRSSSDSDTSLSGRPRKNHRPSLVMTSLHSDEQDVVISVVKKLGGFVISEVVNETTTHVVCGEPRRTLNVLQCVARGAWLLNKSWVLKSLEAGSWISEEEFECHKFFPVCKIARLEREQSEGYYKPTLFSGVGPIYVSGRSQPPRQSLVQLIKLCGGQVTGVLNKASVYVGSDFHPGLTCLKAQWILECITQHRLLPEERFSLGRPKREASPVY